MGAAKKIRRYDFPLKKLRRPLPKNKSRTTVLQIRKISSCLTSASLSGIFKRIYPINSYVSKKDICRWKIRSKKVKLR